MNEGEIRELIKGFFRVKNLGITDEECAEKVSEFMAFASLLHIKKYDEICIFLTMLETYRTLNEREIQKNKEALYGMAVAAEKAAISAAQKAGNDIEAKLAQSLNKALVTNSESTKTYIKKTFTIWIISAVIICCIIISGICWSIGEKAYQAGFANGYEKAKETLIVKEKLWGEEKNKGK